MAVCCHFLARLQQLNRKKRDMNRPQSSPGLRANSSERSQAQTHALPDDHQALDSGVEPIDAALDDADERRIVARPDGYYWLTDGGRIEVGPFASSEDAWANMHAGDEDAPEPGETLEEAEAEIGLADWNDPDTGEPAEAYGPRVEDH